MADSAADREAGRDGSMAWLRAAGAVSLGSERRLLWSVAEGRRGRRWRWSLQRAGSIEHAVLLELDPAGRPTRLEATSASGLLTLHPELAEGGLHGNLVTPNGVEHLSLPWLPDAVVDVVDGFGPFALAAAVGEGLSVGEAIELPTVTVDRFLRPVPGRARLARLAERTWSLEPGSPPGVRRSAWTGSLDDAGRPMLDGGRVWPLELD
jgi:hypothetical protein